MPNSAVKDQKQIVKAFFDSSEEWQGGLYNDGDDHFARMIARRKSYALRMLNELPGLGTRAVIDIGCGSGAYLTALAGMGFDTYGMDYSTQMLEAACETASSARNGRRAHLFVGDVECLPLKSEKFDLVLCVGVLGYLLVDLNALQEMGRILRPGGFLLVGVRNLLDISSFHHVILNKLRSLIVQRRRNGRESTQHGGADAGETRQVGLLAGRLNKSYNLWRFEKMMKQMGYRLVESKTFGYEFRMLRKVRIIPESALSALEVFVEKLFHRVAVPILSYGGQQYLGVFQRTASLQGTGRSQNTFHRQ
jgi:ubiquinone/menaquinone biosynthesis C-methylase UbiE